MRPCPNLTCPCCCLQVALQLLHECAKTGSWLCLKNLHLVVSWLPTLEKEIYGLTKHADFRIYLTSEPHPKFPTTLLESALKITYEAPPGLKKNLQRSYDAWNADFIKTGSGLRAQLLFSLAWFHAIVQVRCWALPWQLVVAAGAPMLRW